MDEQSAERRRAMVERHLVGRGIRDGRVLEVMGRVPRERFVPADLRARAYDDATLPLAEGQSISQPYMVAVMSEALALQGTERVLEIGTGSGYGAAVLGALAAQVITVERHPALAEQAGAVLRALAITNVSVQIGDGSRGWPGGAPYDAIVVTAGAPVVPAGLVDQLASGGRLVIPIGDRDTQTLWRFINRNGALLREEITSCVFVPLIGAQGWRAPD